MVPGLNRRFSWLLILLLSVLIGSALGKALAEQYLRVSAMPVMARKAADSLWVEKVESIVRMENPRLSPETASQIACEVVKSCGDYSIPLELALALIRVESRFDPRAVSHYGARGLTQILPSTGYWLAQGLHIQNYTPDLLFSPPENIRMGIYFLAKLYREYGNYHQALTAYNRGREGLKRYEDIRDTSESGYSQEVLKHCERYRIMLDLPN